MASDDVNIFENIDNFLANDSIDASQSHNSSSSFNQHLEQMAKSSFDESSPIVNKVRPRRNKKSKKPLNLPDDVEIEEIAESNLNEASTTIKRRSRRRSKNSQANASLGDVIEILDHTNEEIDLMVPYGQSLTRGSRKKAVEILETQQVQSAVRKSLSNFEEENCEIMVKVYWKSKLQKHPLRMHQQFSYLCEALAEQNSCDAGSIVLTLNDKLINQTATPDSIGYTIGKFIYARSMQDAFANQSVSRTSIELKIQSAIWKKPIHIRIEPTQQMKVLVILCAEQLKCQPKTLQFKFDGELLDVEATPQELDLEGGEVLDLRFIDL